MEKNDSIFYRMVMKEQHTCYYGRGVTLFCIKLGTKWTVGEKNRFFVHVCRDVPPPLSTIEKNKNGTSIQLNKNNDMNVGIDIQFEMK